MTKPTLIETLKSLELPHEITPDVTVVYVKGKGHGNRVKGHIFRRIGRQPDKIGLYTLWYKTV